MDATGCHDHVRLQVISGISILASGYTTLSRPTSVYYWTIIFRFSWFSTITHLAALTCLRTYLFQHPTERLIRVFLIGSLALMLLIAMAYTRRLNLSPCQYAICYFRLDWTTHQREGSVCFWIQMNLTHTDDQDKTKLSLVLASCWYTTSL